MTATQAEPRFSFGHNWAEFLRSSTDANLEHSIASLSRALGDIKSKSFLDVGCGSGLHSLAALRLGASRVHSFDYDPDSVVCAESLRSIGEPWTIDRASVLDEHYLRSLGKFDIVYAWGVLHHTGQMWKALDLVTIPAADRMVISIYNDQGSYSHCWRLVKRVYANAPRVIQQGIAALVFCFTWGKHFLRHPLSAAANLRNYSKTRGMSPWTDAADWAGGYPFEVARPEHVIDFITARGFSLERSQLCGRGHGCNEFVFRRPH